LHGIPISTTNIRTAAAPCSADYQWRTLQHSQRLFVSCPFAFQSDCAQSCVCHQAAVQWPARHRRAIFTQWHHRCRPMPVPKSSLRRAPCELRQPLTFAALSGSDKALAQQQYDREKTGLLASNFLEAGRMSSFPICNCFCRQPGSRISRSGHTGASQHRADRVCEQAAQHGASNLGFPILWLVHASPLIILAIPMTCAVWLQAYAGI
jgi:hypothetical protein